MVRYRENKFLVEHLFSVLNYLSYLDKKGEMNMTEKKNRMRVV